MVFVAPPSSGVVRFPGRVDGGLTAGALVPPSPIAPLAPAPSSTWGASAAIGAAALLAAALGAARQRRRSSRARGAVVVHGDAGGKSKEAGPVRGEDIHGEDIYYGAEDSEGVKNYVNPWETYITDEETGEIDWSKRQFTQKFHHYKGPVYKQVPVVEGIQFPLDPNLYKEPLVPPPAGKRWGDGRAGDGNWYMEIDGEQVQYWQGVGRRKTACAIVRIIKGPGQVIVNSQEGIDYFSMYPIWWLKAMEPLAALSQKNDFDVIAKVFGGGKSGQAGAMRLGLARAMQEYNYNWRPLMKKAKYLTRDSRTVESKKTGRHKARKDKPYHKR